jgi:hypothetical protein
MESEEKYKFKELAKKTQQKIKNKKIQDSELFLRPTNFFTKSK